jgi:triosephosphate isomerase
MAKIIIANWKSNKDFEAVSAWMEDFSRANFDPEQVEVIIAPAMPFLTMARSLLPQGVALSAQDLSPFPAGSYTGAVSAHNLSGLVDYVILGHSERRQYFNETHQLVAQKVEQALALEITPIVCVDRSYISQQADAIDSNLLSECIVAYETPSAIGSGKNVAVSEVVEAKEEIRAVFGDVKVIYGGSVNDQDVAEYFLVCDGVLVGTASLEAESFIKIIARAQV